jgi:pimeloyl-ACP methyl ester carboxylesterase
MNSSQRTYRNGTTPTVLLVHGAFADASIWAGVIPVLLAAGMDVIAPANPLRGLAGDAAYLASVAAGIDGPVLLAGHAYGGAVIGVAGAQTANTVGLVYVSGYALDEGERVVDIDRRFPSSRFGPSLRPATFASGNCALGLELYVKQDAFVAVFAADLSTHLAAVLAVTQRPIAAAALEEPCPAAAWKTIPSWYAIATADQVIHPEAQRFMAHRASAQTMEVDASHAIALAQPAAVADLIRRAANADRPYSAHSTEEDSMSATS